MSLSQIGRSIKASPTLDLNQRAAMMRAKGEPVIHLGCGEPRSKVPIDALIQAAGLLNTGEIRYTPAEGTPALKAAIIRYMEQFYAYRPGFKNVMASSGAKQAIMVALQAIVNPHDEVLFPAPYWVSYPDMVQLCQGVPVPIYPEDGSFQPSLEDIKRCIGSNSKVLILNSPNNPTGIFYPAEFIQQVVLLCEKHGIWLIMDDIYHRLLFDGRQAVSAFKYAKDHSENSKLIVINGVSKQYAMTGFRIGWAVGNERLIRTMTNIQSHQTSGPSILLQEAAVGAMLGSQSGVQSLRLNLENSRDFMVKHLRTFDNLRFEIPQGTFYLLADFSHYMKDSQKLAALLLEKVQVVTVPGIAFGMEGHLRLSYCGDLKAIKEGVERIKWVLDPQAPNELFIGDRKLIRDWN